MSAEPAPERPAEPAPEHETILALDRLSLSFGGLRALSELELHVGDREVVSVIGPNGAGKTTVFNVITGVYRPDDGDGFCVVFNLFDLIPDADPTWRPQYSYA